MIGKLRGVVDSRGADYVILDVGGVGYICYCSSKTLQSLPAVGEFVVLFIEMYVREEQISLFGFISENERDWFRLLKTVQGVGNRVALAVLSAMEPKDLAIAITINDLEVIVKVPGIGKRLAERITIELRDKVSTLENVSSTSVGISVGHSDEANRKSNSKHFDEAVSVLTNLGYPQSQAVAAIFSASKRVGATGSTEQLIRFGLQQLLK